MRVVSNRKEGNIERWGRFSITGTNIASRITGRRINHTVFTWNSWSALRSIDFRLKAWAVESSENRDMFTLQRQHERRGVGRVGK